MSESQPIVIDLDGLTLLDGSTAAAADFAGRAVLIVNVASRCGLTPQYTGLEEVQRRYADRGFTVLGFPCNQFGAQEPGSAEEIATFCSATYGVTFPMAAKIDVNGADAHPIYRTLVTTADAEGEAGDVTWNFEKFLLDADHRVVGRFRPRTEPSDEALLAAIEAVLPR